jgi:hypothetical protein
MLLFCFARVVRGDEDSTHIWSADMLTQKQKDLLLLIDKKIKSQGVPPSYDEMKS